VVDRIGQFVLFNANRARIFCVQDFLDSYEGDRELQEFMSDFTNTSMFLELARKRVTALTLPTTKKKEEDKDEKEDLNVIGNSKFYNVDL
jgi:hypothetical protein